MKIKFNKFERVAGLFVLSAIGGTLAVTIAVAAKKGWFESKINFVTILQNGEGLHAGTGVQIAGLRAGEVNQVDLVSAKEVRVHFEVQQKFHSRIRKDSRVMVIRPFVIGEKILDVTIGSDQEPQLEAHSNIESVPTTDLMDLVSGRGLGSFLTDISGIMENLKILMSAFSDGSRAKSIVRVFDDLEPLVDNVIKMAKSVSKTTDTLNKDKRLEVVVGALTDVTRELQVIMPEFKANAPNFGAQMGKMVMNLAELTEELKKLTPAINAIAPDLPKTTKRAVEALDEAVIVLKTIQKSFLFSGSAREVREEELKRNPAKEPSEK